MGTFLQTLFVGLRLGSVYALIALGYTMVYGIIRLINFAHGDFIMVGGYTLVFTVPILTAAGLPAWTAVILGFVICALVGVAVELIAYRPVRQKGTNMSALITAIAMSLLLEIYTIIISALIMCALYLFTQKTKMGRAMRCVSEDKEASILMGVNVNTTIVATFAIGAGLAAVASLMYVAQYPKVYTTMGSLLGLKAFVAAVLGGIGIVPGAMLGGLVIGLVESFSTSYISSSLSDTFVFLILIVVLIIKPAGILGKNVGEKV